MATVFVAPARSLDREHRFFLWSAAIMATLVASGFGLQLAMGRSSFSVPIYLHVHAFIFFGWTVPYLVQKVLACTGSVALHRRLSWIALGWIPAMVVMGTYVTVVAARTLHVPFFFQPAYFLVMNPLSLYVFAGLAGVSIAMQMMINVIAFSPLGSAIYRFATAGSAGAAVTPLAFPPPPWARAKAARAPSERSI